MKPATREFMRDTDYEYRTLMAYNRILNMLNCLRTHANEMVTNVSSVTSADMYNTKYIQLTYPYKFPYSIIDKRSRGVNYPFKFINDPLIEPNAVIITEKNGYSLITTKNMCEHQVLKALAAYTKWRAVAIDLLFRTTSQSIRDIEEIMQFLVGNRQDHVGAMMISYISCITLYSFSISNKKLRLFNTVSDANFYGQNALNI